MLAPTQYQPAGPTSFCQKAKQEDSMNCSLRAVVCAGVFASLFAATAMAQDQTKIGAGNAAAIALSGKSPMVRSAHGFLIGQALGIKDNTLRRNTLDILANDNMCVLERVGVDDTKKQALLEQLITAGLVNPNDGNGIPGGLLAGVFPPILDEGTQCPHLPQKFSSSPGSAFGGHHSYPGGLPVHESFNDLSDLNFGNGYRFIYGRPGPDGLPVVGPSGLYGHTVERDDQTSSDLGLSQDVLLAAPLWHDWAKSIVFQWNADGSEFIELNFGGNGLTDAFGAAGDSRTGGHHIISVAEAMKRGLAPDMVIAQASAHSTPTNGNEYKVVNWLRAAAILAQIDPVAKGYLTKDNHGNFRLPPVRKLGDFDLVNAGQFNLLAEYVLHNLSDSDFTLTGPAVTNVQLLLATLAPEFGFDPSNTSLYNNGYRNPVLSFLTAERLLILYNNGGLDAVRKEVHGLRDRRII
jgi:hypothetical protein